MPAAIATTVAQPGLIAILAACERHSNGMGHDQMLKATHAQKVDAIATEAMDLLGSGRQVAPFALRFVNFDLKLAYEALAEIRTRRQLRGETAIGRKLGFTNRGIWAAHEISGPIWSYIYDTTVFDLAAVGGTYTLTALTEPRIEPEIALHIARVPHAGMNDDELLGCIDWVCHAFEIVHSVFRNWHFTAADAVAAHGLHVAFLLGEQHDISADRAAWRRMLSGFDVKLSCENGAVREGHASNVLGGPLSALRFLVRELANDPASAPLRAGELVSTGTLTAAMPVEPGQNWSTEIAGAPMQGLKVRLG